MAEVTSYTKTYLDSILNDLVKTGAIDEDGNMTLTTQDGTVIPVGTVLETLPTASTGTPGILEIAGSGDISTGTDTTKAVTPAQLAALDTALTSSISGKQASDSDLTAIAALTPSNDDVMQRKSGAWANRTMAQLLADIDAVGAFLRSRLYSGSAYAVASAGARVYVGSTDPTASETVVNGSVWFDTT
jgi:hypothetical protein